MRKLLLFLIFIFVAKLAFAAEIASSNTLIEKEDLYNNKEIIYKGEAVGDVMVRGDYFWVNVLEGTNAIGIWCPKSLKNVIQYTGDYGHKGDVVLVRGIFQKACTQHGGDLDIHATAISKIGAGYKMAHAIDKRELATAIGSLVIALILGITYIIIKSKPI